MQLARLVRPHPRGVLHKLSEMLFALRLERSLSKREVLEQYLTRVPLGSDVRGVEAAARLYFDRPAAALTVPQAEFIATLARRPARLRDDVPLDFAREKVRRALPPPPLVQPAGGRRGPPGAAAPGPTPPALPAARGGGR